MQIMFYGYGTGWHWCYYLPLTVQIVNSILGLFSLRSRPAVWNAFPLVKAYTAMIYLAIYIEVVLPIPGFVTAKMLHLVPFRSPAWTLVYYYIIVWHFPCGVPVIVLASKQWLCFSCSCKDAFDSPNVRHACVAQAFTGCCAGPHYTFGTQRALSLLCMVVR
jgi:hypothetical protein